MIIRVSRHFGARSKPIDGPVTPESIRAAIADLDWDNHIVGVMVYVDERNWASAFGSTETGCGLVLCEDGVQFGAPQPFATLGEAAEYLSEYAAKAPRRRLFSLLYGRDLSFEEIDEITSTNQARHSTMGYRWLAAVVALFALGFGIWWAMQ